MYGSGSLHKAKQTKHIVSRIPLRATKNTRPLSVFIIKSGGGEGSLWHSCYHGIINMPDGKKKVDVFHEMLNFSVYKNDICCA